MDAMYHSKCGGGTSASGEILRRVQIIPQNELIASVFRYTSLLSTNIKFPVISRRHGEHLSSIDLVRKTKLKMQL